MATAFLSGNDFNVKILSKDVVIDAHPVQEHRLPLSNLDLTIPPVSVSVFLCYKKPTSRSVSSFAEEATNDLKCSLSEALVYYYVFAGQMVSNSSGEPELLCNNLGVEFIQASANIGLAELDLYNPDKTVEGKLVPKLSDSSVFATQVTKFSFGGIIIGCTFDHRIADAFSTNMFLLSWAELSRKESFEMLKPNFNRSLLRARQPPYYCSCSAIEEMYTRHSCLHLEKSKKQDPPPLVSRIYYLNAKDVQVLQSNASGHCKQYSKLVAFSAYLWKLLILSQEIHSDRNCSISVVVDGRTRLTNMGMSSNYFGNVLLLPLVEAQALDIINQPLSWSAKLIHDVTYSAANEEHFQSLIDWVEMIRPDIGLATIYCRRDMALSGPSILVSSGLRFPLPKLDYGWGQPCFGSYHFPWGGEAGYVMPLPSSLGDGSWVVYMHLPLDQLEAIESHVDCLFHRITANFLGLY